MKKKDTPYTIFVVDDSDVYRSVIVQALESENETSPKGIRYRVHGFASGEECIAQVHLKPDIVIMDYLLNGNGYLRNMNGLELLQKIRDKVPDLNVIVLSCQDNVKVVKDFMRAGIRDYIRKEGLAQHRVKQAVAEFIRKWEVRDNLLRQLQYLSVFLALAVLVSVILFLVK